MNLGQVVADALPELRVQAESLMRGRCTIERENGTTWNGTKTVPAWMPVHVDVPCRVSLSPATSRALVTDQAATPETPVVKIPAELVGVQPDDRVTLDDGRIAWVTHAPAYDDMVQIRLQCRWVR